MALTKEQILTLLNLEGVGKKSILKVGNYINDSDKTISCWEDIIPILDLLKVKVKNEEEPGKIPVEVRHLQRAETIAKRIIEESEPRNIGIISYYEDDFPQSLRDTISEDGKEDPPILLYYKGDLSITKMPSIAIIGTREMTPGGEKAGRYLTKEFVKRGFCIVSGLAIGCDTCAHRSALDAGGKTIAILAHGLDSVYPPENEGLATEIVEKGGLLLSEYPIGMSVNRYNLVARDRLQAAMGKATLVIQTGVVGGTMHAANTTLKAHKSLYAIYYQDPETQNHEKTIGNEYLVNKGAKYIKGSDDLDLICEEINNSKTIKTGLFG